ncbi:MAG: NAD-dependent epimerase/dehydratase [Nitrosomonas sp.]|nr:MAG: NAD-dependent epimerase/dehydratase [Nitrosomonas sp.]
MNERHVGLLGATSLVGERLITALIRHHWQITAFTRRPITPDKIHSPQISWQQLTCTDATRSDTAQLPIPYWICMAPIWVLPDYFDFLVTRGIRRIVVLSSTSRFTKNASSNPQERALARKLSHGEALLQTWANSHTIEYIILRPTLIYGYGRDKNITEIAKFIRRFGFFPLLGAADGLRQPIHADDVAFACLTAIRALNLKNRSYNLAGGEILPYRDMVKRIFERLGRRPCMPEIPLRLFQLAVGVVKRLPRYRHLSSTMAERMNQHLQFDYSEAQQHLNFHPRAFHLTTEDLPVANKK